MTLTLPKAVTFDVVSLQEAVDHRGQRIESFAIEVWNGSDWVAAEKISSDDLTTVGHRRLIRLKSPVTTNQVRIRITGSRLEPTLAEIGLFKQSVAALPPAISDRDTNGLVTISNTGGCKMVYTVDGTAPTTNSPVYSSPIAAAVERHRASRLRDAERPARHRGFKILRRSAAHRLESGRRGQPGNWPGKTTPPPMRLTATRPRSGTPAGTRI